MAFSSYKTIGEVLKEFQIQYEEEDYLVPQAFAISEQVRSELEFNLTEMVVDNSEQAICEMLIYPMLREIWKHYKKDFMLWSHQALKYNEQLSGVPDYILAKRSPLGKIIFEIPYVVIVEAKKDKFTEGWGQCSAELVAAQKLNNHPKQTVHGIVSNGERWEFGKLEQEKLTKNRKGYAIEDLEKTFAAINAVFEQCRLELQSEQI